MGRTVTAAVTLVAMAIAGFLAAGALARSSPHCRRHSVCHTRLRLHCKRHRLCLAAFRLQCPRRSSCGRPPKITARPTTTPVTTTTPGSRTWASETNFPAPTFKPLRTIDVSTAAGFWDAWSNLRPGDEIDVHGVAFSGESVFKKQLPGWAEVHFDSRTTFTGKAGSNLPAAWIDGCRHIRFYGGTLTNPTGGSGVTIYDSSYFTWWGFHIHDTANTGLFVQGIDAADDHLDLKGEISRWGLDLALDPHREKGTGLHGANLADSRYGVRDSRFALYLHDGAVGAGVEAGGATRTDGFWNNTLYLRCQRLTMAATSQVAGNCFQAWGDNVTGNRFVYLEAENLQGRPYDANGLYSGQSLATNTVEYGRASKTNLNPHLKSTESQIPAREGWDARGRTKFLDVAPRR